MNRPGLRWDVTSVEYVVYFGVGCVKNWIELEQLGGDLFGSVFDGLG